MGYNRPKSKTVGGDFEYGRAVLYKWRGKRKHGNEWFHYFRMRIEGIAGARALVFKDRYRGEGQVDLEDIEAIKRTLVGV